MKVRASVKVRCEKCSVKSAKGVVRVICTNPVDTSKDKVSLSGGAMARIAGVDIPKDKRIEVALTYLYGIGPVLSKKILEQTNVNPDTRVRDLTDD